MSATSDTARMAEHYMGQLDDSNRADDACHSLLELGPSALPEIQKAFRASGSCAVRRRLAQVVCYGRWVEALPFFAELLGDEDPEIWKTALDGLVSLGCDRADARPQIRDVLRARREVAPSEQVEWIDEAMEQVSSPDKPA